MDGNTYPYLDLAALPQVGETLLDTRPAFVASADGARLLHANAAGAAFFGARNMGDLLRHRLSGLNPLRSQIARLAQSLPADTTHVEMLRVGRSISATPVPAACRRVALDGGAYAVLVVAEIGGTPEPLEARAERLVALLAANDCLAAVLTAGGDAVAASGGFDDLLPAEPEIDAFVEDARTARERLTKRTIGSRQAGVAHFRAEGNAFILVIVGPPEAGRAAALWPVPPSTAMVEPVEPSAKVEPAETPIEVLFPDLSSEIEGEPEPEPQLVLRFVFETDAGLRFTFVSRELAAAVGEEYAAIVGHRWPDVAGALGFGPGSGLTQTVHWPTNDGDTVAIELAASPVFSRDGRLIGHRGFGAIRTGERRPDTRIDRKGLEALPVALEAPSPPPLAVEPPQATADEPTPRHDASDLDDVARESIERGRHGRGTPKLVPPREGREEPPAIAAAAAPPSNVVRLPGTAPAQTPTETLTGTERDAFRRIAEALGSRRSAESESKAEPEATPKPTVKAAAATPAEIDTRLLDRLPIGIVIFRERKTLFANRTLLDFLFYDSFPAFVDAGGADAIFPGGSGLAGNIAEAGGKLAAMRRDGETVPVRAFLHAVTFAGSTALMLSIIAGRERASASEDELTVELALSEARAEELEAILDTATDGVIVFDGRGKIGSMNRAAEALFGVEAKNYAGRYFTDLIADESQKGALDYLDGLAANGVASVLNDGREVIGRVPAGGLIPLFMTMGRIGNSEKFCAVLRDITHWKNVESELIAARRAAEAANTQKSDFLAKISHEIRTPLNAILGFSEVMMGEKFGPIGNARYRDYLHDIHVSGAHLMSLINDLLDLSKIEAGKVDLAFEAVPVNATIQECVALMQPQANRERIIIRTSLAADVPNVVADQRSFRQILLNIMSNAVKFTRAGGQVIVSSSLEANGEVIVRIRDTGIGMSEKDLETALKPFRQVALAKEDRERGTGLGLPLTKAMVEANRATFAIDSAPNQGTLVKITFPTTRVLAG